MKKIIQAILVLLFVNVSYSQCVLTPSISVPNIDCGDSAIITLLQGSAFNCDFDSGVCPGWDTTSSAQINTSCATGTIPANPFPGPNGQIGVDYLWMGNLADVPRTLTTAFLDLTYNDSICFDLIYAIQGGTCNNAEGPDLCEEGVSLQYSIDTGLTWVDIAYFMPDGQILTSNPGPGYTPFTNVTTAGTPFTVWNHHCIATPLLAKIPGVKVRWIQEFSSTTNFDHWGLDNVSFPIFLADLDIYFTESNDTVGLASDTSFDGTLMVSPYSDSLYQFYGVNYAGDTCYDSIALIVNPTQLGPDLLLDCNQNIVQLNALGVSMNDNFFWTPVTAMSDSTILNPTVSPLDTTDYIFTSSCGIDTVTVNVISNYFFSASDDTTICVGDQVVLEVFGGAQSVVWTPNDGTISDTSSMSPTFSPTTTTTYTVTADSVGCIKTKDITIFVSNKNFGIVLPQTAGCSGSSTGAIISSASGSLGSFYYELYNGIDTTTQSNGVYSGLSAGVYTIFYKDSMSACPVDTTVTVPGGYSVVIDSINSSPPLCVGASNGSLEIFIDTNLVVDYSINGGVNQNSSIFNNLVAGTYNVIVTNGTCVTSQSVNILAPTTVSINLFDSTDVSCGGGNDGEIQVNAINGMTPYQFSLNDTTYVNNAGVFTSLSAGNYNIFVMDNNGCKDSLSTSLSEPLALSLSLQTSINPVCNGDNNGEIIIDVINGTAPYQFSIDSGVTYSALNDFSNLSAGFYTLIAQDTNGCFSNVLFDTIIEPSAIILNEDSTISSSCGNSDGSIFVSATGGTPLYQYSINNGVLQSSGVFSSLSAGTYNIKVVDNLGCDTTITVSITDNLAPSLSITFADSISCIGFSDAEVHLSVSGGSLPYQFSVDNGVTFVPDSIFVNLSGGIQNFLVQDGTGCQAIVDTTIFSLPALVISASQDSVSCNGLSDGVINITASSGTAPYTFAVNDTAFAQTSSSFTSYSSGNYIAYVIDANGCISSVSQSVYEPSAISISATQDSVSCFGLMDGEIHLVATGGNNSSPYNFALNNILSTQQGNNFTGLAASNNMAYVIDVKGCVDSIAQEVFQPDSLVISTTTTNISCNADGNIIVNATGGTPVYSYLMNGTIQASNNISINTAGNYNIQVIDANNCTSAIIIDTISAPGAVTFTIDSIIDTTKCNGSSDAYFSLLVSGGSAPYTYSKDGGVSFQNSNEFIVSVGTYSLLVKDAFGCVSTTTNVNIYEPTSLTSTSNSIGVSCFGLNDGSLIINTVSGGTSPYFVNIGGADIVYSPNYTFSNLSAGNQVITITDANGCTFVYNETIANVTALNLDLNNLKNVTCYGDNDGEISVTVNGGSPVYNFSLINGSNVTNITSNSSATFTGLSGTVQGTDYVLEITDGNGCVQSFTQTISSPEQLFIDSIAVSPISCFGADDGTMQVFASGGLPSYTFSWEPTNFTTDLITGLSPMVYTATVTDANGCIQRLSSTLENIDPVIATLSPDSLFISMGDTVQLNLTVQNALGTILQYDWTPTTGLSCSDCSNPYVTIYNDIEYHVEVTDSNGCANVNTDNGIYVIVNPSLFFFIPNGFTPNGDGVNDNFQIYGQDIKSVNMMIFNRIGEKIFQGNTQFDTWDGKYNDKEVASGVYSYHIEVEFLNDVKINRKGSITIVR